MAIKVNFLWIGTELSDINLMSLQSFNKLGYDCILWKYKEINNVPDYVTQKDANKILPLNEDIYAGYHSDYFRFLLLHKYGGIYSDLDNILLKTLPVKKYIIGGEQFDCNSNLIKVPKNSILTKTLIEDIENKGISNLNQYNGVDLYNTVIELKLDKFIIKNEEINYFGTSTLGIEPLVHTLIDWKNLNTYNVHLFESHHRVVYRNSEVYKTNMKKLKSLLL